MIIGCNGSKVCQSLDLETNKWINVTSKKYEVVDSGIYYDDMKDLIYVGGGYQIGISQASKFVECYDVGKNVWNQLRNTNYGHDMNPLIWIENYNLLHIMSVSANCMEYIDLREVKEWIVKDKDVSKLFNTTFSDDDANVTANHLIGK